MNNTLLPCPFCGGEAIVVKTESCGRYIGCWDCGGRTEKFETDYAGSAHDKAISAWNRRAEPENNPLTLEELRQMDGEPVWVDTINRSDPYHGYCVIDDNAAWMPGVEYWAWRFSDYGKTWLAYRTKPERSEG